MAFTDYGVKTGDFLSPFLFILCTEELISFPRGSEEQTYFVTSYCESKPEGISYFICWLHHLFCQAWVSQCIEIVNILDTYGKTPEQRLDAIKSSLVFGNKMVQEKKKKNERSLWHLIKRRFGNVPRTTRTNMWFAC